jgi:hypothetical protein
MSGNRNEVNLDPSENCPLFDLRFGAGKKGVKVLKQIKIRCKDCFESVKKCQEENCPLFPYRFGHNPARRGIGGVGNVALSKPTVNQQNFTRKTN